MTRLWLALVGVLVALLCLPLAANAAWSARQQVKGQLSSSAPVIGVDETGTMALGFVGTASPPATYVERPPGLAEWNSSGVTITKITGSASNTSFALSGSGAAVAAWTIGGFANEVPWAAYKPPGKPWGAATQLDNVVSFGPVIPLIDEAGHAAVVWARKNATYDFNMPNQIVYAAPTATAWPAPAKIADITVPVPHDQEPDDGIDYNRCGVQLRAAILPGGTPVVSWDDDYASYKQGGGPNDGYEIGLCSVRTAVAGGGAPTNVTPRPNLGFYVSPTANMPSWTQTSLVASPTDTDTAILLRGREDSLKFTGCSEVDACADQERDTRAAVGTGASLGMGTSLGAKEIAAVALRNDRTLLVSRGPSSALRAGVGIGVPGLTALPENFQLLSAGLALSDSGAAHVAAVPDNLSVFGLHLFDAPAAGAFAVQAPQVETSSGANKAPSLALDCEGKPVMAWAVSPQLWSSSFDGAPAVCGDGPDPEPEPEPGPKPGGGGSTPAGPTVVVTPPPVPSRLATVGAPKSDGSTVTFTITCSPVTVNACAGKTVITQSHGGGKKARAAAKSQGVKIGSLSFSGLKPGAKKTLKIPLVKSAKQELAQGKSIKATITATVRDGAGNVRVTTRSATLKKPR